MDRRRLVTSILIAGAAAVAVPVGPAAGSISEPSPGRSVVVEFDGASNERERRADLEERGLELVEVSAGGEFGLAVPVDAPTSEPQAGNGSIESIEPVVTYRAFGVPNDPAFRYQWHLAAIDAVAAWDVTDGSGAVVAVIDTGVAYTDHGDDRRAPDLAGSRFVPGWDFVDSDAYPSDENGHGTHVASTIAATTDNAIGVAGAAPGATIMPLRVLDAGGAGTDWDAAQAVRFAADHGADVINMSLGSRTPSSVIADAVAYARSRGVTVVAASGNDGAAAVSYPAALEGVIAVGAVRQDLTRPSYANFGSALDIVAPGGDTTVDQNGDGYRDGILQESFGGSPSAFCFCFFQGTSMAAPQVSAVASMLAARGVSDPDAIEDILVGTARDLGTSGRDDQYGHGLVQADAAVRAPVPVPTSSAPTGSEPATSPPLSADAEPTGSVRGIENACPPDLTPAPTFRDLADSVHAEAVGCVAWWDVASGRTPDRFEPGGRMTRAQLASFVARLLSSAGVSLPPSPADAFQDDDSSVHELAIDQLAELGVVRGRSSSVYSPGSIVTRAEMATFLVRAHDLVAEAPLMTGADRFVDDDGSTHEENIDKVAAAGLAAGTSSTTFKPTDPVLRGQMATFLARTLDLFVYTADVPPR